MVMCCQNFHFSTKFNPRTLKTHMQATKCIIVMGCSKADVAVHNKNGEEGFLKVIKTELRH